MNSRLKSSALRLGVSAFAVSAVMALTGPAMAAETTSTLQGHVNGAATGTKVVVTDASNGTRAEATVRADGSYVVVGLRPGTYHVVAGSDAQDVTLVVGETTTLDLNVSTKSVVIVGRRKQVRTSEVATNVSHAQIETMPQDDRNFMNLAALAPGINLSTDPNNKQFQAGAVESTAVNVFIDGQSQKNQVIMGGIMGQDSSRGDPFPLSAISEYKVSTQNFKAEYEQASSAIITAVTKTGTNDFHGSVYDIYRNKDMSGQPHYDKVHGLAKPDYKRNQWGIELGGPIVKDKLFFYVTTEKTNEIFPPSNVSISTTPSLYTSAIGSLVNSSLISGLTALNGNYPAKFSENLNFGKLTYTPDADNTLELSMEDREERRLANFGGNQAYSERRNENEYVRQGLVSWKHRGDNVLNEASLEWQGYHWGQFAVDASPPINLVSDPSITGNTVAMIGGSNWTQVKGQDSTTFKDNLTFTGIDWHGSHVVKMGVKFANYRYTADEGQRNTLVYTSKGIRNAGNTAWLYTPYTLGNTTQTPLGAIVSDGNPVFHAQNGQVGLFLQDDWTVDEHLAWNLGLRWDYESNMTNQNFVTPSGVAAALRGWANWTAAGINANDYISTGSNRKPFYGAFQPRLGFSYDLNGDRQTVFFGGFGRYYDRTLFDRSQLELRKTQIHTGIQIGFKDSTGSCAATGASYCITYDPTIGLSQNLDAAAAYAHQQGIKGELYLMPNKTRVPYSDQLDLGIRQQFGAIQTSATLSHVDYHDQFRFLVGNRQADGSWGNAWCGNHGPNAACTPWGDGLPGYGSVLIGDNSERSTLTAVYLTAEKPYTKASGYSWSVKLDLNNAKSNGQDAFLIGDFASPKYYPKHWAEGVPKWNLFATGRIDLPYEIVLSGTANINSGTPQETFLAGSYTSTGGDFHGIGQYWPKNPYTEIDARLAKDFTLPNGTVVTADFVVTNLFDSVNRTYSIWGTAYNAGGGFGSVGSPPSHQPDQATYGPPRQFQVGLHYKW